MHRLTIGTLILSITILLSQSVNAQYPPAKKQPIPVEVVAVTKGSVTQCLSLTGTVYPSAQTTVCSEIAGPVAQFNLEEGSFIKAKGIICQIDKTRRLLELDIRKANFEEAQAEYNKMQIGCRQEEFELKKARLEKEKARLEKLRLKKERQAELFNQKMTTAEDKENSELIFAESQAQVADLEAALKLSAIGSRREEIDAAKALAVKRYAELIEIQDELVKSNIVAPFPGVLVAKLTEKGEWVQKGSKIAQLINLSKVHIHAEVAEKDITKIKLGQIVQMSVDALPGLIFNGRVKQIIPQADEKNRNFPVRVEVDNPKYQLFAGMLVRIMIPLKKEEGLLWVPRNAVIKTADGDFVFLVKDAIAYKTKVTPGATKESLIAVSGKLSPGDKVVVNNNKWLQDKATVLIRNYGN